MRAGRDPRQLARQIAGVLPPLVRILGERGEDDALDGRRRPRLQRGHRRRVLGEDRGDQAGLAALGKGALPGDHLVDDQAERVDVGARVDHAALELLGRHVGDGADQGALGAERGAGRLIVERRARRAGVALAQLGEAEVEQLDAPFGQHHVAWLEVAVGDAFAVRAGERLGERGGVLQCLVERQRSARQPRGERLAVEILHDQVLDAVLLADVVERADVGMVEPRDGAGLALEAQASIRLLRGIGRQHLDGDGAGDARVGRPVDLPHAPPAQEGDDLVRPQAGTGM